MSGTNLQTERSESINKILNKAKIKYVAQGSNMLSKDTPISEYFGCMTFGLAQMRDKLPKSAYQDLLSTLDHGQKMKKETAEACASAIKEWAVSKGATHFCHWFQPMTGLTAEKHDAFISIEHTHHSETKVVESFTGSQLIQGEPDASSFPSGGMRSTFEARGYTAWDPSSPIFIVEDDGGKTLCIPSVFFGYHGQALDNKTPLLRSVEALSEETCAFLNLISNEKVKKINVTLGAEQEYFLIDKNLAALRPDIIMTGRTLQGAPAARGQQLEDHYFGSIPTRVKNFMQEVEFELYKLGIPVKTRHNEVAPSQFELAPIFEQVNISADHNALTMEVLKRVAIQHDFVCLLHEKPFAGINGSGKHNNWSMATDKGENLLEPGKTPHQNLRFLAVLSVVLRAVHTHAAMMRTSIASPGNDHRLGANEAPPAIISVFLGKLLEGILNTIEKGHALKATEAQIIDLGVSAIPNISKDYTDRNRTSPFAFTGNKFEFRAVGSSQNVSFPMTILNAAVAHSFKQSKIELEKILTKKKSKDEAVMELIQNIIKETKAIRFDGNGYSDEWKKEAKKRSLPILNSSADALAVMEDKKLTQFLSDLKVFSPEEISSRYHIYVERFVKTLEIEHRSLIELCNEFIIPSIEKQLLDLYNVNSNIKNNSLKKTHKQRVSLLEKHYNELLKYLNSLELLIQKTHKIDSETKKMKFISESVKPVAESLRQTCDNCEILVANENWSLPKYREMLFFHTLG